MLGFRDEKAMPEPVKETRIPAGALTIGVEYKEPTDPATAPPDIDPKILAEYGWCIYVYSAEDEVEHVRFDCFQEVPHYHYIHADEGWNLAVPYDPNANGPDMVGWVLGKMRNRLPEMLREAGQPKLAGRVDPAELNAAVDKIESMVVAVGATA